MEIKLKKKKSSVMQGSVARVTVFGTARLKIKKCRVRESLSVMK